MKKRNLFLLVVIVFVTSTQLVKADGGFFRPTYYTEDLFEPTQKAVILFNKGEERLVIQASYKGSMKDFAWVVPTPGYPVVNKSDPLLFEELHYLTEPNYVRAPSWPLFWGVYAAGAMLEAKTTGVTLLERYQVGIYDVSILSATNSSELIGWLNGNNYSIPQDAKDVIQHYISKNWYFVAIRINLAPYNENLINSLKNIDSRITDQSNAVIYLTEDLVNYVKEQRLYNELTAIRDTELKYGEETESKISQYPYDYHGYYGSRPTRLIEEYVYTSIYETYNGYLDDHLRSVIWEEISFNLMNKVRIPYADDCYRGRQIEPLNYSNCYVWYFTKDSEEYKLLKDVNCGQYCSRIASTKEKYSAEDLAYVAANAIMGGNENIKNYFGIDETRTEWYQNYEQQFNYVYNQVYQFLINRLTSVSAALQRQIESALAQDYSQKTGMSFSSVNDVAYYFSVVILEDIKSNKTFSESYYNSFGLIRDYELFRRRHLGEHNEFMLKNSMESIVKNVVYLETEQVASQLKEGTIQPLMVTFNSDEIVYPLKMTSINKGVSEVLLYVFANHKTTLEGFETEYAKWINTEDINTKTYDEYMRLHATEPITKYSQYYRRDVYYFTNQLLDDRYYLTKMRRSMYPSEMEDLTIGEAKDNTEYRMTIYENNYAFNWFAFIIGGGIIAALIGILFVPMAWLNNRFVLKENKGSIFFSNKKRCFYCGLTFTIILGLGIVFSSLGGVYQEILRPFSWIFEFLGHLLNFIGMPGILIALVVFFVAMFLVFEILNTIGAWTLRFIRRKRK